MNHYHRVDAPQELLGRCFKSGNSIALRLPKALGFKAGDEVIITDREDGTFTVQRVENAVATFDALYGAFSEDFMAQGRDDTVQKERDWDNGSGKN